MLKNTYSEEEFKRMVKTLLHDKKEEDETPPSEVEVLQRQLEKVKPAIKRLMEDLKETKAEVETLRALQKQEEEKEEMLSSLKQQLEDKTSSFASTQEENQKLHQLFAEEKLRVSALEDELRSTLYKFEERERNFTREEARLLNFEEERTRLLEKLAESVATLQRQGEQLRDLRQELFQQSESRSKIEHEFEKLRHQYSMEHQEHQLLKTRSGQLEESEKRLKSECETISAQLSKKDEEMGHLTLRATVAETALKESDLTKLRQEHEKMIDELKRAHQAGETFQRQEKERALSELAQTRDEFATILSEKERAHEEVLAQSYTKLKEVFAKNGEILEENHQLKERLALEQDHLSKRVEETSNLEHHFQKLKSKELEREQEVRKAQGHLAKKVKENAMLRDVLERQKKQLIEQQSLILGQKNEVEKLKSSIHLQKVHEEKLEQLNKERAQVAENASREWQEKYFAVHQEWQEAKAHITDLLKMKKNYEQLQGTFSNMKSLLGKTSDSEKGSEDDFFD